jgi:hypothetical protein
MNDLMDTSKVTKSGKGAKDGGTIERTNMVGNGDAGVTVRDGNKLIKSDKIIDLNDTDFIDW